MIIEIDTATRPSKVWINGQRRTGVRVRVSSNRTDIRINDELVVPALVVVDGQVRACSHPHIVWSD